MSTSAPFAVVIIAAVAAGILWIVVASRRRARQADFERRVQARKLGWSYVGERDGRIDYRFNGASPQVAWSMWYDSDRGDESPTPKSIWKTGNLSTPDLSLVIVGASRYRLESGAVGRLLMGVVTGVAQAMTGAEARADKSEFYESAVVLDEGSAAFREAFTVAVAPDMPRGWLDEELQSLLRRWPAPAGGAAYDSAGNVEVSLRSDGLQIVAQKLPQNFACWQHLARLGEALAARLASHTDPAPPPA